MPGGPGSTRRRSPSDEEEGEIGEIPDSGPIGGARHGSSSSGGGYSSYAALASSLPTPKSGRSTEFQPRTGRGRSSFRGGRGGRGRGNFNDSYSNRDGGRGRGRGRHPYVRGGQRSGGRSYVGRSSTMDNLNSDESLNVGSYSENTSASRGGGRGWRGGDSGGRFDKRRNSLDNSVESNERGGYRGGGRFHRGGRGRSDSSFSHDNDQYGSTGRGGRSMGGRGARGFGRGRGRSRFGDIPTESSRSSSNSVAVSDYASLVSGEPPVFAGMKRPRESIGSEGEIVCTDEPNDDHSIHDMGVVDKQSTEDVPRQSDKPVELSTNKSDTQADGQESTEISQEFPSSEKNASAEVDSTAVPSGVSGDSGETSSSTKEPSMPQLDDSSARESNEGAEHADQSASIRELPIKREREISTEKPLYSSFASMGTGPPPVIKPMPVVPKREPRTPNPNSNGSNATSVPSFDNKGNDSTEDKRVSTKTAPIATSGSSKAPSQDRPLSSYTELASANPFASMAQSSPRPTPRESAFGGRGPGIQGGPGRLGIRGGPIQRGGRNDSFGFGRMGNFAGRGRGPSYGGRSELIGGRSENSFRGRGRGIPGSFSSMGRPHGGRLGQGRGDFERHGDSDSFMGGRGRGFHSYNNLSPREERPASTVAEVQVQTGDVGKPLSSYSAMLDSTPLRINRSNQQGIKREQPETPRESIPPVSTTPPPSPPPEPKPADGRVLALTRLANMEAEMEFAYAKHMMLKAKQRCIRVQCELLENLPYGIEAIEDDLNKLEKEAEMLETQ